MANGIGYKMNKAKKTASQFTVIGRGEFPMDMLRYDGCYPKSEKDTTIMGEGGLRELMLHKTLNWGHPKIWSPTVGRWNSFGWAVLSDLPMTVFGEGALTHNAMLIARLRQPMKRRSAVGVSTPPILAGTRYRPDGRRPTSPDGTDWGIYGDAPREQWNGMEYEAYHEQETRNESRDGGLRPVHDGAGADGLRPDHTQGFP